VCDEEQLLETWRFWSKERMGDKFMVLRQGRPIGLVFDYERTLEDGHTKIAAMLLEDESGRGAGVIAIALFGQWLLQNLPLKKLYLEVFEFNRPVIRMLEKLEVRKEMQRVKHRYWNGKHWDQYGFAFYREDLPQLLQRLTGHREITRGRTRYGSARIARDRKVVEVPPSAASGNATNAIFDEALDALIQGV
jgi:RimJ/RimL family protein N-acetyltransferase